MFAIIRVGGKQYRVENGSQVLVDRLHVDEGAAFEGVQVLLLSDGDTVTVGAPIIEGATVAATIVRHQKGKKIRVFKYKPKKNYRRRIGARAHQTLLRINSISANGQTLNDQAPAEQVQTAPATVEPVGAVEPTAPIAAETPAA